MPLLDSALAFAITMLALSLICSSIVELIHRIFRMRQAGFKYMLDQMFDQVLSKYVEPALKAKVAAGEVLKNGTVEKELEAVKTAFVDRMRANRAPMGVEPYATPEADAEKVKHNKSVWLGVWAGRELTELSSVGFMERLGTMDLGATIADGVDKTAVSFNAALQDIAQKFEALGKDAADYFEGRARLLSVFVAVVFAFVVHADAVDLYTTYLQNPNATAAVIAKSAAITAKYESTQKVAGQSDPQASSGAAKNPPPVPPKDAAEPTPPGEAKNPSQAPQKNATPVDGQKQAEEVEKDTQAAKAETEKTVKQFADLGVPLGWTDDRYEAAHLLVLLWSCKKMPADSWLSWWTVLRTCKKPDDENTGTTAANGNTNPAPAKDGDKGAPATGTAIKGGVAADAPKKVTNLQYTMSGLGYR